MLGITTTNARVGGFRGGISAEAKTIYNRIIADGGVSNLSRLNFFVKGLKSIYGDLANVPVCYDAHWIGYKLGSGTGATAGQAAAKLYSLTVAGDAVQTTAASQPLLLVHSGANYWFGSGVAGNFVRTPNATANQIIGDFDIKVQISTKTLSGSETGLFTKYDGINNKAQYMLVLRGDGALRTYISSNGTSNSSFISTAAIANNWDGWVRVTRDSTVGTITYYTSLDGSNWTQLGATTNLFTGNLYNGNTDVEVGAYNAGVSGSNVSISVLRATISNSIGGAPVVDFNPNTYNASTSQTAWTSATGEIWTISTGTATTGYKGVLVDRTIVQGDGVDDKVNQNGASRGNVSTQFLLTKYNSVSGAGRVFVDSFDFAFYNAITFLSATQIAVYQQNNTSIQRTITQNLLAGITVVNNAGANIVQYNNGAEATNTTSPSDSKSGITLMAAGNSGASQCGELRTYICVTGALSSIVRTDSYNFIKTLNNL
jgi:hypothetical protein